MEHLADQRVDPGIINYIDEAVLKDAVRPSYIFEGVRGSGRLAAALYAAKALLCTDRKDTAKPCNRCHSCSLMESGNHPDCIIVTREETDKEIKVDTIRDGIVDDIGIKPYYGGKKIYIIPDAELMNESASNALLKTLEEPPEYAVIILIASGRELLLPTIRSRCMTVSFRSEPRFITDDEELNRVLDGIGVILSSGQGMDISGVLDLSRNISKDHAKDIRDILDTMEYSCRNALLLKSGMDLTEEGDPVYIEKMSGSSYERLELILSAIKTAREDIRLNVSKDAVMDSLLLHIYHSR